MTKSEELAILRDAAERLGPDSYCGPWLAEQLELVERDMLADLAPAPVWGELRADRADLDTERDALRARARELDVRDRELRDLAGRVYGILSGIVGDSRRTRGALEHLEHVAEKIRWSTTEDAERAAVA